MERFASIPRGTRNDMHMEMGHHLPRRLAVVNAYRKMAYAKLRREKRRHFLYCREKRPDFRVREFRDVRRVCFGNHDGMPIRQGVDVEERESLVRLVDFLRRDIPRVYFAKNTIRNPSSLTKPQLHGSFAN